MAMDERMAGSRNLTADVHVSRISCGLPMRRVSFLVRMMEEVGGSMVWCTMKKCDEKCWRLGSCVSSFALVEGGLDSPLTGLLSGSLISSADVDSLFQDLDSNGR